MNLNYARKPSTVDIDKLKKAQMRLMDAGARSINDLVGGYEQIHDETIAKNINEVSKAFHFVSLLHLANENNFILQNAPNGNVDIQF